MNSRRSPPTPKNANPCESMAARAICSAVVEGQGIAKSRSGSRVGSRFATAGRRSSRSKRTVSRSIRAGPSCGAVLLERNPDRRSMHRHRIAAGRPAKSRFAATRCRRKREACGEPQGVPAQRSEREPPQRKRSLVSRGSCATPIFSTSFAGPTTLARHRHRDLDQAARIPRRRQRVRGRGSHPLPARRAGCRLAPFFYDLDNRLVVFRDREIANGWPPTAAPPRIAAPPIRHPDGCRRPPTECAAPGPNFGVPSHSCPKSWTSVPGGETYIHVDSHPAGSFRTDRS